MKGGLSNGNIMAALRRWVALQTSLIATTALLAILAIDGPFGWQRRPLLLAGIADETAHLLTTALLLAAIPRVLPSAFVLAALVGSVLIDLDHLPLLFGSDVLTRETARPFTHSLLTIGCIWAFSFGPWPGWRRVIWGGGSGVAAHLVRDLASTTAGVPLFWPLTPYGYAFPYGFYLLVLIVCLGAIWGRAEVKRRHASLPPTNGTSSYEIGRW